MNSSALNNARCPICKQTQTPSKTHAPFCSQRCADLDLGRWLRGAYAVAAVTADPDEDEGLPVNTRENDEN